MVHYDIIMQQFSPDNFINYLERVNHFIMVGVILVGSTSASKKKKIYQIKGEPGLYCLLLGIKASETFYIWCDTDKDIFIHPNYSYILVKIFLLHFPI